MEYSFIRQNNSADLLLFFAGWGMDAHPFQKVDFFPSIVDNRSDLCIVYDYRSLQFDETITASYQNITLIAWSLGVWAAEQIALNSCNHLYAVNGTPQPIDDTFGIPASIFYGTLNNLSEQTLKKFNRRMCDNSLLLRQFETSAPQRTIKDLYEELATIAQRATQKSPFPKKWNTAFIGNADKIFPPENQLYCWQNRGVATEILEIPHFPFNINE